MGAPLNKVQYSAYFDRYWRAGYPLSIKCSMQHTLIDIEGLGTPVSKQYTLIGDEGLRTPLSI